MHCSYHDAACVDMFRAGGDILGTLCRSGNGVPVEHPPVDGAVADLERDMAVNNRALLNNLREDVNSDVSFMKAQKDAELNRMSWPRPLVLADA